MGATTRHSIKKILLFLPLLLLVVPPAQPEDPPVIDVGDGGDGGDGRDNGDGGEGGSKGSQGGCVWPSFLQNDMEHLWVTNISTIPLGDRVVTNGEIPALTDWVYVLVEGSQIQLIPRGSFSPRDSEWKPKTSNQTCIREVNEDRYIYREETPGSSTKYGCVEYKRTSDRIVLMFASAKTATEDERNCEDDRIHLDSWPIIINLESMGYPPTMNFDQNLCPAHYQGGFTFLIFDKIHDTQLCAYLWNPGVMDICGRGEGIKFQFNEAGCIPQWADWTRETQLHCVGWFIEGEYLYIITLMESAVKSDMEFDLHYHLLRGPKTLLADGSGGEDPVFILYKDPIIESLAEPQMTQDYLQLTVKRIPGSSHCVDESEQCPTKVGDEGENLCANDRKYWEACGKSCNLCSPYETLRAECLFDNSLVGSWALRNSSAKVISVVTIGSKDLLIKDTDDYFMCYEDKTENLPTAKKIHEDAKRYVVRWTNKKGCRTRFACLDIYAASISRIFYRFGAARTLRGAETDPDIQAAWCEDKAFSPPKTGFDPVTKAVFRSPNYWALTLSDENLKYSACHFWTNLYATTTADGSNCNVKISNCLKGTELTIISDECFDMPAKKAYKCVYSFVDDVYEAHVVHDLRDFNSMICIVNHRKTLRVHMIESRDNLTVCFNSLTLEAYVTEASRPTSTLPRPFKINREQPCPAIHPDPSGVIGIQDGRGTRLQSLSFIFIIIIGNAAAGMVFCQLVT